MNNQQTLKLLLAVVAVYVLYRLSQRWTSRPGVSMSPSPRVSTYVPFDEMPFDTVPPRGPDASSVPPLNVSTELLPKPVIPQVQDFGEFAPNALGGLNFLEPTQKLGLDTQGSSLRNANRQIRADPPNPRMNVGPWNQSTIEPDLLRRPLEG